MNAVIEAEDSKHDNVEFGSVAWLLVGWTRTSAGRLFVKERHVAFADEEASAHFCTSLSAIQRVWSPWYYFGGGLKMKVDGKVFRLTFVRPNDQPSIGSWRTIYGEHAKCEDRTSLGRIFPEVVVGRMLARKWRALLRSPPNTS